MNAQDAFGGSLEVDPSIALKPIPVTVRDVPGPMRRLQYVIELVGQRTAPAQQVDALLNQQWQAALGQPQLFVMSGADQYWRILAPGGTGSYDSIALAWDIETPRGALSPQAAQHLLDVAENFAKQIGRRAMPMPVPQDILQQARVLDELRENLDVGVNLSIAGNFKEADVWRHCVALGLEFGPNGLFGWKVGGYTLFEVGPGELERFSLGQVQRGVTHDSLTLGFGIPVNPAPEEALKGCLYAGGVLAQRLGGVLLDEDERPVSEFSARAIQDQVAQAVGALKRAGFEPGSEESLKLFGS